MSGYILFSEMVEGEPKIFGNWEPYVKTRQVVAAGVVFINHGWFKWQMGHARLFGVLLWDYERRGCRKFKYNKTLKKHGYCRTHNYRLLSTMIENKVLKKDGNGYYCFTSDAALIKKVLTAVRELDRIGSREMPDRME